MLGPLVNSAALVVGGVCGALLGRAIPRRVSEALPLTCGMVAAGIGTAMINKVHAIPAVALALLLGALIGELLSLERGLERAIGWAHRRLERWSPKAAADPGVDHFVGQFVTLLVLFTASGMGVFGALQEGSTRESSILITKAILDLFTATIFAAELGFAVALIALPQLTVQALLYFAAALVLPFVTPAMQADFAACGGIVMLATGLRICGIKFFPIVNMLPALLVVMPCSALWSRLAG